MLVYIALYAFGGIHGLVESLLREGVFLCPFFFASFFSAHCIRPMYFRVLFAFL